MTQAAPYYVPKEPGRWRALGLAVAIHVLFLTFLWIGVRWQNEVPIAIEAEVWDPQIKEAAPPQPEPEVAPEPPKPVIEQPVVKPEIKPDIALEQEKKRKEEKAREEEQKKLELAKKEAAEKKRKEQEEQKRLDKIRQDTLNRMLAQAGPATGEAAQTQGPRGNAEYLGRVAAKIKSNTVFAVPDNLAGNPPVEYAVELLPDGSIRRPIRKIRPSGVPGFDEAVLNAIEKSQPFPPDRSGKVPSGFNIVHRPKDQ